MAKELGNMKYAYCERCANRDKEEVCKTCGLPSSWTYPTRFAEELKT